MFKIRAQVDAGSVHTVACFSKMKNQKQISACYIRKTFNKNFLLPIVPRVNIKNNSKGLSVVCRISSDLFIILHVQNTYRAGCTGYTAGRFSKMKDQKQISACYVVKP